MKKLTTLLMLLAVTSLTAWAGKPIKTKKVAISDMRTEVRLTDAASVCMKAKNATAKTAAPSWSESFEAWPDADKQSGMDYFWLPEGWSRKATPEYMTQENPHTWFVNTQSNIYVPAPVDGRVYAEIMYNDAPQDEWLYTCELTPKAGEWLQYYVIFRPFTLFEFAKYDYQQGIFTEYNVVGNLLTYISVDGGEYQLVADLAEEYKTANARDLYDSYANGELLNKKVSLNMSAYVGHTVKVGFRYVATDGDSMWLDALTLGQPDMDVAYDYPESALFLGMTKDLKETPPTLFLPDNAELTWTNTSSQEAQSFEWAYPSSDDFTADATSTDRDLTVSFNNHTTEATDAEGNVSVSDMQKNTIKTPVLKASGIAGLATEYANEVKWMKIGGKAHSCTDGTSSLDMHSGATTCNPLHGVTITATNSGYPLFGYQRGVDSPWTQTFGLGKNDEAHVSAILNHFPKPAKAATVRGLWIQGTGKLTSSARLKVGAYKRNVYGSLDETPVATAIIDVENIYSEPVDGADDMYYYSIPFIFADPLVVNDDMWYRLEGIDKAFSYFAPLQDDQPSDVAHGYIDISYTYEGSKGVLTYSISNLLLGDVPCNNSFFFNLDMAYGDCSDWQHVDIEQPQPEMPEITIEPNTMRLVNLDGDEMQERHLPMRCGFYKNEGETLTLYPAIGELYTYEGGPFYTDDLPRTYYYEITMPRNLVGTEQQINGTNGISVRYYDIMREEWMLTATSGTITVVDKGNGTYAIDLRALDIDRYNAVAMNFNTDETWRWREYGEYRPNPNVHKLTRGGKDYEVKELNSCVMDTTDDNFARLYFCTTPNITTVEQMNQLPADDKSLVVIEITKERMNGNYLSFSMTRNNPELILNIYYNGEQYSSSRNDIDGGNACIEYNPETKQIDATSMLFTLTSYTIDGGYPNWSLKYNGTYTEVNANALQGTSKEYAIELTEGENAIASLKMGDPIRWYKTTAKAMKRTKVLFTGYPVMTAFLGEDLDTNLGIANPVDYINLADDEVIYIRMESTNEEELTATVTYGAPVPDLSSFGALAYSIEKNDDVAGGSSIVVSFPNHVGGADDDEVTLNFYIFSVKGGSPDGAPVNLGGVTTATGTLGEGVPVLIEGLTVGKKYRLSVQSLMSGNHYAPGYNEQTITSGYIDFYFTEATGIQVVEAETSNAPRFSISGQRVGNSAKGIIIINGKKIINK